MGGKLDIVSSEKREREKEIKENTLLSKNK